MAIAHVASVASYGSSTGGGTTSAIDTTGANLIVIAVAYYGSSVVSVTDSKSNSWTGLTARTLSSSSGTRLFYCVNPTAGSGHTVDFSGTTIYPSAAVLAVSGAAAFDIENGAVTSVSGTSYQPGSLTPSENDCLVVTSICTAAAGTGYSIDGSFTAVTVNRTASYCGGGIGYKVQTTAGAENPTWSWSGGSSRASAIASFTAASGGGGSASLLLANAAYFGRQL